MIGPDLQEYAAGRARHLASIAGEPGYAEAVQAEAAALSLAIIGRAIDEADEADRRLAEAVEGLLMVAIRVAISAV